MVCYKEYQPSAAMGKFVECYWELNGTIKNNEMLQEVLVPGGRAEIIFTNAPFFWYGTNKTSKPEIFFDSFLLGPRKAANYMGLNKDYCCVGVRLRIGCLQLFTGMSANIHANNITPLSSVFITSHIPPAKMLVHFGEMEKSVQCIELWLNEMLQPPPAEWYKMQHFLADLSLQGDEVSTIKDLSLRYGWNYKKTERIFLKYTGLSPRTLLRLLRFRYALETMKSNPGSLTHAAHRFGFYDQSHFIREFHNYAGSNPSSFYKNIPEIAALLYKLSD